MVIFQNRESNQPMAQAAVATVPALIAELRAHLVRKTGRPIDPDVDFLTTQIETLSASGPSVDPIGLEYGLSPKEYQLVGHLARRPGMAFTRDAIMNGLYSHSIDQPDTKLLDVMVSHIRAKLLKHRAPFWIEAVWGRGFRFVKTPASEGKKYATKGTLRT